MDLRNEDDLRGMDVKGEAFSVLRDAADNSYSWLESSCISNCGEDGP